MDIALPNSSRGPPTLAAIASALPPKGEQFAPWDGPAARMYTWGPILRGEPDRAVGVDQPCDAARVPQVVEMGDRFTHRKEPLLHVELTSKQHGNHVCSRLRRICRSDRRSELVQAHGVMPAQLCDAKRDAAK